MTAPARGARAAGRRAAPAGPSGAAVLAAVLAVLLALLAAAGAARAQAAGPFPDPAALTEAERRFLQGALAWEGSYLGLIDGEWGARSEAALAAAAAGPRGAERLADLLRRFARELETGGWAALGDEGPSFLAPLRLLELEAGSDRQVTLRDPGNALIVRLIWDRQAATVAMHDWLARNHAGPEPLYRSVTAARWITGGRLANGRLVYLWSVPRPGYLITVTVQTDPREAARYRLIVASLRDGPARPLALPPGGRLARWLNPPPASPPSPAPAPGGGARVAGSGTGFFVGPDLLVTAQHVIDGCRTLRLADGSGLALLRQDAHNDLALLRPARPSPAWLTVNGAGGRLAETVYALGYPLSSRLASRLTVTSGTLSALPAPGEDPPRMLISAPVQPGNSGGPVLGADGGVIGVVVSRLDDLATLRDTGALPQNVNFAVPPGVLLRFLAAAGAALPPSPLPPFRPETGLPDRIDAAVVRVDCLR